MSNNVIGNRIMILGCPVCGKDIFAEKLHARIGFPLIHLNEILKINEAAIPREEYAEKLKPLLNGDRWIAEGDGFKLLLECPPLCDTIIFLDYDEAIYLERIKDKIDMNTLERDTRLSREFQKIMQFIRFYQRHFRPRILQMKEHYPGKALIILKTPTEAEDWLAAV